MISKSNPMPDSNNERSYPLTNTLPVSTRSPTTVPLAHSHCAKKHCYLPDNPTFTNSRTPDNTGQADKPQLHSEEQSADLAVEAAVAIVINGIHYAVLMASPHQLEYLAVGFLFSEGLIEHSHQLLDWEVTQLTDSASCQPWAQAPLSKDSPINNAVDTAALPDTLETLLTQLQDYDVYVVELRLSQRCHQRIQAQKRQLAGRTGCGMCGITGLTQALPDLSAYTQDSQLIRAACPRLDYLLDMRQQITAMQHTHQLTGAVHAAATLHDEQLYLFEDVGRHNALDKLIGWQLRNKREADCVLMTSRLSIELVQKSIRSRIPWLVGMSAPTSTAVRVAQRYGLGLAGFLRDNRVTYYTGI